MAKLPTINSTDQKVEKKQPRKAIDSLPVPSEGYSTSLAHVRRLDVVVPPKYRRILSDKIRRLQDAGATLNDGTEVTDKTKAFLWILENEVKP